VLSPRAAERLASYVPPRPLPKIFRLAEGGKLNEGVFRGETINTPSMLCVEDALDGLRWAESLGGLAALVARSSRNLAVLGAWVEKTPWVEFLAKDPAIRSSTSICLSIVEPWFQALSKEARMAHVKKVTGLLEKKAVAYDINSYVDAPPGLRIWGGSTIEASDLEALTPWLDWAYSETRST